MHGARCARDEVRREDEAQNKTSESQASYNVFLPRARSPIVRSIVVALNLLGAPSFHADEWR